MAISIAIAHTTGSTRLPMPSDRIPAWITMHAQLPRRPGRTPAAARGHRSGCWVAHAADSSVHAGNAILGGNRAAQRAGAGYDYGRTRRGTDGKADRHRGADAEQDLHVTGRHRGTGDCAWRYVNED
jgi:hypothetical protein